MINVGAAANDGTGDDLREAFVKINQNFEDLDLRIDDKTEGANVGSGIGIFKQRTGYDLQFKSLTEGSNIQISEFDNQIQLSATGGLQNLIFITDSGSVHIADGQSVRFQGGTGIDTEWDGTAIRFNNTKTTELNEDNSPVLGADLNANLQSINNVNEITAQIVNAALIGNVVGNISSIGASSFSGTVDLDGATVNNAEFDLIGDVHGIDIRDHNEFFTELDLGNFASQITNWYDLLRITTPVDMGTVASPSSINIDAGSF